MSETERTTKKRVEESMLYAIAGCPGGDETVEITVFQDGNASTVELSQPFLKQLIEALNRYVQKDTGRIPSGYRTGTWRGTLPIDPETNKLGICFNIDDDVLRIKIKAESAKKMVDSITEYIQVFNTSQKEISSLIPSSLGSIPDGGQ